MSSDNSSARELAAQLRLHRSGNKWRGNCPACGYADAFVLADGKSGPIGWCASCGNRESIAETLVGGQHKAGAQLPHERDARDLQKRLDRAEKIWRGSEPVLGTLAANYLNVRGIGHLITCSELRFRADCPHPNGSLERPVRLPALVAAVRDADGRLVGVHRTYPRRDGSGKAEAEPQKASLGNVWGGAVRLSPLEHVLNVGELVLAEGIESAGSAALLLSLPAWAALSAGNLANGVVLPAAIRKLVIAADRDSPDQYGRRAGQDAARTAWFRWRAEGRSVRVAMPDEGRGDFNDIALAQEEARS